MTKPAKTRLPITKALGQIFTDRQVLAMLIMGLASGLPYVAVLGTLNAWFSTVGVKTSTIGLMSWAAMAYVFKFMWAASFQNRKTPFKLTVGPRRFWLFAFQILITIGLFIIAFSDPPNGLGKIAIVSVVIAILSASFDIVLAAWRIESARDDLHLDILSTAVQFGYRTASLLGGFVALILADYFGWRNVFIGGSVLMAFTIIGTLLAKPLPEKEIAIRRIVHFGKNLSSGERTLATAVILLGWGASLYLIARFMVGALNDPTNYSSKVFMQKDGLIVIGLTVILLTIVAAYLVWTDSNRAHTNSSKPDTASTQGVFGIMYAAIVEPMMEMFSRLGPALVLILALVMTYRFTDLIWGSFAYPFYLGENFGALGHTLSEVGYASKLFGVLFTILGIGLGGLAMLRFGRMPVLVVGAILAAATNLLFADLASGARFMDGFLGFTRLDDVFVSLGSNIRFIRLTIAIAGENIAVGVASAASIAYLSSVVNKEFAAVQYALLVSLTFLFGILGRPLIGDIIEERGFAYAFILCAALGGVAVVLSILEWFRQSRGKHEA